jgi:hypothetical protein
MLTQLGIMFLGVFIAFLCVYFLIVFVINEADKKDNDE